MIRSWLLCHAAAAILGLSISYARGETCSPPNVPTVFVRQFCERGICQDRGFVECRPQAARR